MKACLSFFRMRLINGMQYRTAAWAGIVTQFFWGFMEILLYRVRDICLHMNLWQRLFRVGTIHLETSDKTAPSIELKSVAHPREVKEQIHRQVEEMKIRRRMRVGEVMGVPDSNESGDDSDLDE